jgi:hypothetical protein
MPHFHDAVTDGGECDEERARQFRECGVRAFDHEAATNGARLRASEVEPVGGRTASHDQPGPASIKSFQKVFPRPHALRRCVNSDGMGRREECVWS